MQVDHFHGRTVTNFSPEANEKGEWWIELEGDVMITNTDPEADCPAFAALGIVKGASSLARTILSKDSTVLYFNTDPEAGQKVAAIAFKPTKYTVADPEQNDGEPVYPQRAEAVIPSADPWPDVLQGPPPGSDSPLAAQEGSDAEG